MCGRLHCVHKNERTEYGDRAVVQTAHTFLQLGGGDYAVCRVAQLALGGPKDVDPGMVPSGAKCGRNMVRCSQFRYVTWVIILPGPYIRHYVAMPDFH